MPNPAKAGRPPLDLRRWTVPKPRVPPLKFHVNKEVKTGVWKEPEARLEGPHPPVTPPPARLLQGTDDSEPPPLPAKAMPLLFYSDTSEGDAKKRRTMMQPRGEETHDLLHEKEKDDGTTVSYRGRNTELPPTDDGTTVSYYRGGGATPGGRRTVSYYRPPTELNEKEEGDAWKGDAKRDELHAKRDEWHAKRDEDTWKWHAKRDEWHANEKEDGDAWKWHASSSSWKGDADLNAAASSSSWKEDGWQPRSSEHRPRDV